MSKISYEGLSSVILSMIKSLPITFALSILIMLLSMTIAIAMALCEYFKVRGTQNFIKVFTSFFRGTPLIAQLFFVYYGMPNLIPAFINMTGFSAAVITMSLNNSAYIKEAIRGALLSVKKGQLEAGRSLGYNENQIARYILFPQAIRVAIPSIGNSLIDIVKSTSLAFTVGVIEVTAAAQLHSASSLRFFEGYTGLILMYWLITLILERILKTLEIKYSKFDG